MVNETSEAYRQYTRLSDACILRDAADALRRRTKRRSFITAMVCGFLEAVANVLEGDL